MSEDSKSTPPRRTAFPDESSTNDVCRFVDGGGLVCHLIDGHDGGHWDDWEKRYWVGGNPWVPADRSE